MQFDGHLSKRITEKRQVLPGRICREASPGSQLPVLHSTDPVNPILEFTSPTRTRTTLGGIHGKGVTKMHGLFSYDFEERFGILRTVE
jgi:hypothetical protein